MKLLLDMNLTPRWRPFLEQAGHEVVHWSEIGPANAEDTKVMAWARDNGYVVFTHDLDYSALLFSTRATAPSVVQARGHDLRPEILAPSIIQALKDSEAEIIRGALVTVDARRHRVSVLPLGR